MSSDDPLIQSATDKQPSSQDDWKLPASKENSLSQAERAAALLEAPDEERIRFLRKSHWIGYTRAQRILGRMEDLLTYPKTHRMPGMLLTGATNNGKTMIARRFYSHHPPDDNAGKEAAVVPVLMVQAPPAPDEGRLYNAILKQLFAPYKPEGRLKRKQARVMDLLERVGTQMLIIDEVQHVLAGSSRKQRRFLNVIKYLANELKLPIVALGIKDALRAIHVDPQLANRFEPTVLPQWEMDKEYLRLLMSFECLLPLRKESGLARRPLARQLLSLSDGYIGELDRLLSRAGERAIQEGTERITKELLDEVDWTPPSKRKKHTF